MKAKGENLHETDNFMQGFVFRVYIRKLITLFRINEIDTCLVHPYVLKYLLNESSREKPCVKLTPLCRNLIEGLTPFDLY